MIVNYLRKNWLEVTMNGIVIVLFYNMIHEFLITKSFPFIDFIMFSVLVTLLFILGWIKEYFRNKKTVSFIDKDFIVNRKGVIFTLGINSHLPGSAQRKIINTLKPEFFGFITTEEIESNRYVVDNIVTNEKIADDKYKKKQVDPTNIREIKDNVSHIIEWMLTNISRQDIVIDITGGTAVMSCGAFKAAEAYDIDVQYIYSDYDYQNNKTIPDTQKALIVSKKTK